jgi:hypothetical protein
MNTKWITPIIATLLLTACTIEVPAATPSTTPARPASTTPARPTTTTPTRDVATFQAMARSYAPEVSRALGTNGLLELGDALCDVAAVSDTMDDFSATITVLMISEGVTEFSDEIAGVSAAAIVFLCPEHQRLLD